MFQTEESCSLSSVNFPKRVEILSNFQKPYRDEFGSEDMLCFNENQLIPSSFPTEQEQEDHEEVSGVQSPFEEDSVVELEPVDERDSPTHHETSNIHSLLLHVIHDAAYFDPVFLSSTSSSVLEMQTYFSRLIQLVNSTQKQRPASEKTLQSLLFV